MPFRRWFAEQGARHPAAYSLLTLAAGGIVCMLISIMVSVQATNYAIERERLAQQRAEARERALAEVARKASCEQILVIDNAYQRQIDDLTGPGKDIAGAWHYIALQCK